METQRRVVYTEAGQMRRRQLLGDLEGQLDAALVDRKFVPGIEVVEVTASDVEDVARSMQLVFRDRYEQRLRSRYLIVNTYIVLGAATVVGGLFYDQLRLLLQQPTQRLLVATGAAMSLAGVVLRYYLETRTRTLERQRDLLRVIEAHDRRSREPGADA